MPTSLSRRHLLTSSAAVAAGAALLTEAVLGQDNPAANVADKGADLKISALRGFRVGTKAYIKIETNKGIFGWGEVTGLEPNVAVHLAQSLFELLDGENPTRIEHLWQKLYRSHRDMRGGPFMTHVISAIDMALWDITGKAWGVPVYRLLGGPTRDKVRVYPTPKAHKTGTGGPHPYSGNPTDIENLVRSVRETRERVGKDGTVMFDAHCAVPPAMLIQLAAAIEPYDILFLEEPAVPGNIEVFRRIRQQVRVPLAAGERDRTIWEFIPYLEHRCLDILQPDCCHGGGITPMKKVAVLAETFHVPLAPHCTASYLGIAASLHVVTSVPFFLIHEFYPDNHGFNPAGIGRMEWKLAADGYIGLPPGPGLGVEIDQKRLEAEARKPQTYRWPGRMLRDGSVSDY